MPELTPLDNNRQEHFLNGEDLEPITRREHFYAGRESELPAGHQEPETREEWFIQKYRGGGGDITVVPLSVTENGTYSEEGKAYSPVSVNVPLPQNAYLLKSVANLPQAIASFNDGEDMVMPSLKVAIKPVQDLHGYDSPWAGGAGKNKFDISKVVDSTEVVNNGTSLSLTTNPHTNNCTAGTPNKLKDYCPTLKEGDTVTFSFESTGDRKYIYLLGYNDQWDSGASKVITDAMLNSTVLWYTSQGVSTATVSKIQFELGSSATSYAPYSNICPISGHTEANVVVSPTTDAEDGQTYNIQFKDGDNPLTVYGGTLDVVSGELKVVPYYASYNGETLEGEWISDRDVYAVGTTPTIGAQVVNIGATPTTYQLTPTQVKSLLGSNNVWADTGDIADAEYFSKEV